MRRRRSWQEGQEIDIRVRYHDEAGNTGDWVEFTVPLIMTSERLHVTFEKGPETDWSAGIIDYITKNGVYVMWGDADIFLRNNLSQNPPDDSYDTLMGDLENDQHWDGEAPPSGNFWSIDDTNNIIWQRIVMPDGETIHIWGDEVSEAVIQYILDY